MGIFVNLDGVCRRVSYQLGLEGPSMMVDTACSSSLVSAHLAHSSLHSEESQALIVGENLLLDPVTTVHYCQTRMLARNGTCKTFDSSANGYVRSEGCAVLALGAVNIREAANQSVNMGSCSINQDGNARILRMQLDLFCVL